MFGFLASLKKHEMTHSKEKGFKCFHCDKKFASKGDLRKHEKVHTGEKPYSCSMCNKNFSSSSYLRKHVRSHIGEKKCKGQVFATTGLEGQPNEKFEDKRTNGIKTFQIKMESELLENKGELKIEHLETYEYKESMENIESLEHNPLHVGCFYL